MRCVIETLNTLKYANRARNIVNKAVINRDPMSAKIEQMKDRIAELEAALAVGGLRVASLSRSHSSLYRRFLLRGFLLI